MKMIFLDADGTLFHPMGYIPESAKKAIHMAKENGHYICLCTGRQKAEIYGDLADIDYDGMVVGSGAYVVAKDKVLCNKAFDHDQIQTLVDYFHSNQIPCIYESSFKIFSEQYTLDALDKLIDLQCSHLSDKQREKHGLSLFRNSIYLDSQDSIRNASINKISFLESHIPFQEVYNSFHEEYDIIQATFAPLGPESGELARYDINKGNGMNYLIQHFQIKKEDVIAIGDGFNDIQMFENSHISVAMGNAPQKIKNLCDIVTTSIDEDGIYQAFTTLNLI